jgi:hypothetical protein
MICLEDEGCDEYTSCGHAFHGKCLREWFESRDQREINTCPYCRMKMA